MILSNSCLFNQVVPGVPKIVEGYNPATWALGVSSIDVEERLCVEFAEIYKNLALYEYVTQLQELV